MKHLPFPIGAEDDEAVITKLCKEAAWSFHRVSWIAAYRAYRACGGSPFVVTPCNFGDGVGDLQRKLYDTRKSSGDLGRIRRQEGLKSCPVCGSPVTGSLDHYLPRDVYPEFAIMRANLVPACCHCNSGVKGTTVHGADPRRFVHPYFDDWAEQPIWYVKIVPPFEAARFVPHALPVLKPPRDEIVEFHLENVLGTQFHLSMANEWSSFPTQMKLRGAQLSAETLTRQVVCELRVARASKGKNSWQAALMRGILRNAKAIGFLQLKAKAAILPKVRERCRT